MIRISFFLAGIIIALQSFAQQNILEDIGINDINVISFSEYGDSYYFVRIINPVNESSSPIEPSIYTLCKYDKYSHQLQDSVYLAGDTLQTDSVLNHFGLFIATYNGRLNIAFEKYFNLGSNPDNFYAQGYFIQLDTGLNVTVPKKRMPELYNIRSLQQLVRGHGNNMILAYLQKIQGTTTDAHFSKYLLLDSVGNVLRSDTFNNKPTAYNESTYQSVTEAYPVGINEYFVNGTGLLPPEVPLDESLLKGYIADSDMNIIKEVRLYRSFFTLPNAVPLPSGSIISGGEHNFYGGGTSYAFIGKNIDSANFGMTDTLYYGKIDNNDIYHGRNSSLHSVEYNEFDNRVYLVSESHRLFDGNCDPNMNYSYTEIICADTNLVEMWHKFIRFDYDENGADCLGLGRVVKPDNRGGILFSGAFYSYATDNTRQFVYYITDTTQTESPLPLGINGISNDKLNVSLYPNPTNDFFTILDSQNKIRAIEVYDITGKVIIPETKVHNQSKISLHQFPQGLYLIKMVTTDGNTKYEKIVTK